MDAVASMHSSVATAAAARLGAALSDAQYFESGMVRQEDIRRQLELGSVKEKLDAMKRIIALVSLGKDATNFFPSVVKNVVAPSLDVRKLVYMYLVHYAEEKSDLALLAINTLQKDLHDQNPLIRALALKVLSSIRVKTILQVVTDGISRAAADVSPYVRKTAALAVQKAYALDESSVDVLLKPLATLLNDRSPSVVGAAVASLQEIAPTRWDLLHPKFRDLCDALIDLDEWSQFIVLNMLIRYARDNLRRPTYRTEESNAEGETEVDSDDHEFGPMSASRRPNGGSSRREQEIPDFDDERDGGGQQDEEVDEEVDEDLQLLLESARRLFTSINPAVALCAVSAYFHLASAAAFRAHAIKPLVRLMHFDRCTQYLALQCAVSIAARFPQALAPYAGEFLVGCTDGAPVRTLKMKVLMLLLEQVPPTHSRKLHQSLLPQLKRYINDPRKDLAIGAARALGLISRANPAAVAACIRILTSSIIAPRSSAVVSESVAVMRELLQQAPDAYQKDTRRLAKLIAFSKVSAPEARARIIWLVGEFYDHVSDLAPEILRRLAIGFIDETMLVKLEILTLAAKLEARRRRGLLRNGRADDPELLLTDNLDDQTSSSAAYACTKLLTYVLELAENDVDYDVRERARMLRRVLHPDLDGTNSVADLLCENLLARKHVVPSTHSGAARSSSPLPAGVSLGSLSQVIGRPAPNFRPLPSWTDQPADSSLRSAQRHDQEKLVVRQMNSENFAKVDVAVVKPRKYSDIQQFLADSGDEGSDEEEDSDEVSDEDEDSEDDDENDGKHSKGGVGGAQGEDRTHDLYSMFEKAPPEGASAARAAPEKPKGVADDLLSVVTGGAAPPETTQAEISKSDAHRGEGEYSLLDFLSSPSPGVQPPSSAPAADATDDIDLIKSLSQVKLQPDSSAGEAHALNWRKVTEGWNSYGLEVYCCFPRTPLGTKNSDLLVKLRIHNVGKLKQEVTCKAPLSLSQKVEMSSFVPIKELAHNVVVEKTLSFTILSGKAESILLRFSTSAGSFEAELRPTAGEILRPSHNLTVGQFVALERQLSGMFATEAEISVTTTPPFAWQAQVKSSILNVAHMSTPNSAPGQQSDDLLLAATIIAQNNTVLLSVRPKTDAPNRAALRVSCDDLFFASKLFRIVKARLAATT